MVFEYYIASLVSFSKRSLEGDQLLLLKTKTLSLFSSLYWNLREVTFIDNFVTVAFNYILN